MKHVICNCMFSNRMTICFFFHIPFYRKARLHIISADKVIVLVGQSRNVIGHNIKRDKVLLAAFETH